MATPFYVSPEQWYQDKAEYARKGIARGKPIVAIDYEGGIALMAENPSGSLRKISEIYDQIAFAATGRYNVYDASGQVIPEFDPAANGELAALLLSRSAPVSLSELTSDLDVIPGYIENRAQLEQLGISVLVGLISRERLVDQQMLITRYEVAGCKAFLQVGRQLVSVDLQPSCSMFMDSPSSRTGRSRSAVRLASILACCISGETATISVKSGALLTWRPA